jgi:tetratricopeptide (TPR) repeat protein
MSAQLSRPEGPEPLRYRGFVLTWAGILSFERGNLEDALRFHTESKSIAERRGDRDAVAISLAGIGDVHYRRGEVAEARRCLETHVSVMRDIGDPPRLGVALNKLSIFLLHEGDLAGARPLQEEHLSVQRSCGNQDGIALALSNLGIILRNLGEIEKAFACSTEALAIRRRTGDRAYIATTLINLAELHLASERPAEALPHLAEVQAFLRDTPRPVTVHAWLDALSRHASSRGNQEASVVLVSAGEAVRESAGDRLREAERRETERRCELLRATHGTSAVSRARAKGMAMTLTDALAFGGAYVDDALRSADRE